MIKSVFLVFAAFLAASVSSAQCVELLKHVDTYFNIVKGGRHFFERRNEVLDFKNNISGLPRRNVEAYEILSSTAGPTVYNLKKGDVIHFSDDSTVVLGAYLDAGNNTQIFAIEGNEKEVLGIPTGSHRRGHRDILRAYAMYEETADLATKAGYPIIGFHINDGLIFREKLSPFYSLDDFGKDVAHVKDENDLTAEQQEMLAGAIGIARFLKGRVDGVGDVRTEQIAWAGKRGWVYNDFSNFIRSGKLRTNGFTVGNNDEAYEILRLFKHFSSVKSFLSEFFDEDEYLKRGLESIRF